MKTFIDNQGIEDDMMQIAKDTGSSTPASPRTVYHLDETHYGVRYGLANGRIGYKSEEIQSVFSSMERLMTHVNDLVSVYNVELYWPGQGIIMSDRKYLMHFNGKGRILDEQPTDWRLAQQAFMNDAGPAKSEWDWPDTVTLMSYNYVGRVPFDDYLVGSQGAEFTDEEVQAANKIRRDRDVVQLKFLHVKELI